MIRHPPSSTLPDSPFPYSKLVRSLSMVMHELGTTARKYGALSVPGGRLAVSWEVHSIGGFQLHLRWRESGGPPVSAPQERGFGTPLVAKSLAADGGQASLRYQATGLSCDISLPLDRTSSG